MTAQIFTQIFSSKQHNDSDNQHKGSVPHSASEVTPQEEVSDNYLFENEEEGQLAVDVYQTDDYIIIRSTVAGVKPEDLNISIDGDMVTIKGKREEEEEISDDNYLYKECYWGSFSRSIILPVEVKGEEAEATLKNGILTIKLPKVKKTKNVSIKVNAE